jgi:hypothetical protein
VRRVDAGDVASMPVVPAVALVVGEGARASAEARDACAAMHAVAWLRHVPIVVVLPAGRVAVGDPLLDAHELLVRPLRRGELPSRLGRATASAPLRIGDGRSLRAGSLLLEPGSRGVWVAGAPVSLGPGEFRLLAHLVRQPVRVHTRAQLLEVVWPGGPGVGIRAVDVQVRRVRAKLGTEMGDCIRTVRRVGYAFRAPA